MNRERKRNVVLILVGVAGLVASHHATGALAPFAHAHGANLTFSFAAFFLVRFLKLPGNVSPAATAAYTFAGVATQELAQAVGLYPGWFDPYDLLFDAIGVALAWIAHRVIPCGK